MDIRKRTVLEANVTGAHTNTIQGREEHPASVQDRNNNCRNGQWWGGVSLKSARTKPSTQITSIPCPEDLLIR